MHQQWSVTKLGWKRVMMEVELSVLTSIPPDRHMFWGSVKPPTDLWRSPAGVRKHGGKRIPPGDEDEDEVEDRDVRQKNKQEVLAVWWRITLLLRGNLTDVLCRCRLLRTDRANRKSDTRRTSAERDEVRNINDEHEDPKVVVKRGVSWKGEFTDHKGIAGRSWSSQ